MAARHPHGEPPDLIRSVSRALRVLETVGQSPGGLTVKQIARRCGLTPATTYHLIRTLGYEGYVCRRDDGTYIGGLEIADRYRELVAAFRYPTNVEEALRQATRRNGYSHYLGRFIAEHPAVGCAVEGPRSPHLEDLIPGFDDGAHATALGKALLATLSPPERANYLREWGMRAFTDRTLLEVDALEADLAAGQRREMFVEIGEFRCDIGCAAVPVRDHQDPQQRLVLACCLPAEQLVAAPARVRAHLVRAARSVERALRQAA